MEEIQDFSHCRLDKCPQSLTHRLAEDFETIRYHYVRALKMIIRDVRRGMRKPAAGHRHIAPLSDHQAEYLKNLHH